MTLRTVFVPVFSLMVLLATLVWHGPATAQEFVCSPTGDYLVGDSSELRDAVGCHNAATSGSTVIELSGEITGPIQFAIENPFGVPLEIDGAGHALALDPLPGGSPLFVNPANTGPVTVQNLVLDRNDADLAIVSRSTALLTVAGSTITGSSWDGIFSDGPVVVQDTVIADNLGNGVFSWIDVTVVGATITGNGIEGINSQGTATVDSTLISGNGWDARSVNGLGVVGALTVTNSTITSNVKTGIYSGGPLQVEDTFIGDNGRLGIATPGFATIVRSTIHRNGFETLDTPWNGVDAGAGLDVSASIVASNSGNGLDTSQDAVVADSIIENNGTVDGKVRAGIGAAGSMTVLNSTISGNDIGLSAGGSIEVINSTVVGNEREGVGCNCSVFVGASTVVGNSTSSPGSFADVFGASASAVSSIIGGCGPVVDNGGNVGGCFGTAPPSLDALADNGCAVQAGAANTFCPKTMALPPGSSALAAGSCTSVGVDRDQRGVDRGDPCDAGAFEAGGVLFVDVPDGQYFSVPVAWAVAEGVTSGTSATTFSPASTVTRAQMATFLWRYSDMPATSGPHGFSDVLAGAYFEIPVTWLAGTGITSGTSATTFSPGAPLTRGQMATFLWRLMGEPAPPASHPFVDVPDDAYFRDPVAWLAQTGITSGTSATTFSPNAPLTRGQAVTFLYRLSLLVGP